MPNYSKTQDTRLWLIENRAGPSHASEYEGCWKAGSISSPRGEPTIITCPDPVTAGRFKTVGKVPGDIGLPGLTITARYTEDISTLLSLLRVGCDVDLQIHIGACADHQDFVGTLSSGGKVLVLEAAQPGEWSVSDFGALEQGDQAPINEEMPFKGEQLYEIKAITYEEQASSEVVQEIIAILICDAINCGPCDNPSTGCNKVFALTITVGGSPGAAAEVIFTDDGGATWGDTEVDTLGADEDPDDMACVGSNLVVISNADDALHYAPKADILAGTEDWTRVATGFVAAGSPNAIISLSPRHTWVVGDGGYVYFTADPTAGVEVQNAGTVVTDDLKAIHGYDTENLVAVGDSNAVIVTRNGGDTWTEITGPSVGDNLLCVFMHGKNTWFIGNDAGELWYTVDGGTNWVQKTLPGQTLITDIRDVKFSTPTVGWLAADTTSIAHPALGKIYRTIDGGYTWYVTPEGNTSLPANDRINEIATCDTDPNIIFAGGLGDDGADGIIVKGS